MIFQPEVADALSSDSDDEDNAALAAFQAAQATLTAALSTLQNAEELEAAQDEEDAMMEDDFSDEDMEFEANFDGRGSVPGRQNLNRDFDTAHDLLVRDYFCDNPTYPEKLFRRRMGLPRPVFDRIYDALKDTDEFRRKYNPVNKKWGIHTRNRICAALQMLVKGDAADNQDNYYKLGGTTADYAMKDFCKLLIQRFGDQYLNRCPTDAEKAAILSLMEQRGFPGAFASWDCKHFVWKNCPVGLAGLHIHQKDKKKTLVLEAIADPYLYIWYHNFGEPGSLNDLNILAKSTIVGEILTQSFDTRVPTYRVNNSSYDWLYFLADGIYPSWSIFVKTIPEMARVLPKEVKYSSRHEHVGKDVERCFGVLIQRFRILAQPLRSWYTDEIDNILAACIIMHNMVMEANKLDEAFEFNDLKEPRAFDDEEEDDVDGNEETPAAPPAIVTANSFFNPGNNVVDFASLPLACQVSRVDTSMHDSELHDKLTNDLVDHIDRYYYNSN